MTQAFDDLNKYGKDFIDNGVKSFTAISKGVQAIAVEATEYSKKNFESGSVALEKLFAAKSPDKAFEIQSDFAKQSYESFVSQATKMGELYAELAKDFYKPLEAAVAKAK